MSDPSIYDLIVRSLLDPDGVDARRLIPKVEQAVTQEEVDKVIDELAALPTPGDKKNNRRR